MAVTPSSLLSLRLDPRRTGGAGHPGHVEIDCVGTVPGTIPSRDVEAGFIDRCYDGCSVEIGARDDDLLGLQIDGDIGDTGDTADFLS